MFVCTELVTGFDDFGKVIFLYSHCDRAAGGLTGKALCRHCENHRRPVEEATNVNEDDGNSFEDVLQSLLNMPLHQSHAFPLR